MGLQPLVHGWLAGPGHPNFRGPVFDLIISHHVEVLAGFLKNLFVLKHSWTKSWANYLSLKGLKDGAAIKKKHLSRQILASKIKRPMLDARLAFTFRPRRALPLGARWQCNMSGEVLVQMPPEPGQQWGGISRTCQPFLIAFVKYSMTSRSLWDSMAETFSSQINFLRYSIRSEVQHKNTKHMHLIYMYEKRVSGYTCQYCVSWSPFDVRIRGLPIAALSSHNRHTWDTSPVRPSSKPSWAPARLTPSQFAGMNDPR